MNYKNIVVAGGGVLGSQIAYQTAYKGFHVTVWLRSDASIDRSKPKFERLSGIYQKSLETMKPMCGSDGHSPFRGLYPELKTLTAEKIEGLKKNAAEAYQNLCYTTDLAAAVRDADIVIESVAEAPDAKIAFYTELAKYLPEKTAVVTNSSTMVPSAFAQYTGRPAQYLALHFANEVWKNNTAEIMGHEGTDPAVYEEVAAFAGEIGMVPLRLKKEQPGYILNSMLVPFLNAAQALLAKGVADPQTIDMTWMLATGAPAGPFRILDIVGLTTAYNIVIMDPTAADQTTIPGKIAAMLKAYIDEGKTGVNAGEGFYKYR
ncbi:MAG: 3-hydroxyacyl-CoA dehydrogenase [Clostridiales bacterium]|nr:3-hydroxyacyl-CoA dehydrogenase [Clostridiales bacterium]